MDGQVPYGVKIYNNFVFCLIIEIEVVGFDTSKSKAIT